VQLLHGTIVSSVFSVIEPVIGRSPTVFGTAFAARCLAAAASHWENELGRRAIAAGLVSVSRDGASAIGLDRSFL